MKTQADPSMSLISLFFSLLKEIVSWLYLSLFGNCHQASAESHSSHLTGNNPLNTLPPQRQCSSCYRESFAMLTWEPWAWGSGPCFPEVSSERAREQSQLQQCCLCAGGQPGIVLCQVGPCPKTRLQKAPGLSSRLLRKAMGRGMRRRLRLGSCDTIS